jgi:acyl-coenzyme A synthetase/AMP-(fatty) acid ligase
MIHTILRQGKEACPDEPLILSFRKTYSFSCAYHVAARLSEMLTEQKITRVACYVHDCPELVVLLCACSMAGCEACVLNREDSTEEAAGLVRRFNYPTLIADAEMAMPDARCIALAPLIAEAESQKEAPEDSGAEGQDARLLLLTTGSTGPPKGALYSWSKLAGPVKPKPEFRGTRWLLANHLNHFAGIQQMLHNLVNHAGLVIPSSAQMGDALRAIIDFRVEYVSATPTFWRLLIAQMSRAEARRIQLRQITLVGEAVTDSLLVMLGKSFPSAKISQVYGSAELGTCFSVRDGQKGLPLALLERGPEAEVQFKIENGELWVKSKRGMSSYYEERESKEPMWRATGDMVEIIDGRICFVGRTSEVINVGGVKVNPLLVEELVQKVPGVALVRAYGKPNPVTGQIVALDVVPATGVDLNQLETDIRLGCQVLARAKQPRLIRFVQSLDTRNRKILRR